ncbi:lactoylglutathione lyase [Marinobacterium nitratireducens]|uniref:Lactoylglutathione lyase n=1 Tax=Marinobacterium nitratireducens TaxID=518897 RepID=A0A918DWY8_9GAMM|nr:VOC family protein [Marinobacterium nitratireducens]GGO85663.1 lactoylglutathione lyase [Marinobacterium nitratireducens]
MTQLLDENFQGLQHLGVPVTDLECSKHFYGRLGFRPVMEKSFEDDEGPVTAVMVKRGSMVIELYLQPGERRAEVARRRDGHIDHVAFSVRDIDAAFAELRAAGFETQQQAPVELPLWENGCKYFSIRGPGGETLEFNQIL